MSNESRKNKKNRIPGKDFCKGCPHYLYDPYHDVKDCYALKKVCVKRQDVKRQG